MFKDLANDLRNTDKKLVMEFPLIEKILISSHEYLTVQPFAYSILTFAFK